MTEFWWVVGACTVSFVLHLWCLTVMSGFADQVRRDRDDIIRTLRKARRTQ